jgi:hypothetical protein
MLRPLYAWERATGTHHGDSASLEVDLDAVKRTFLAVHGIELRSFSRPARNQTISLLGSPGSSIK